MGARSKGVGPSSLSFPGHSGELHGNGEAGMLAGSHMCQNPGHMKGEDLAIGLWHQPLSSIFLIPVLFYDLVSPGYILDHDIQAN